MGECPAPKKRPVVRAFDTTAELSAFIGLLIVAGLGIAGAITELYLAGAIVVLVLVWGGARVHSVTTEGLKLASETKCPVCGLNEERCACDR